MEWPWLKILNLLVWLILVAGVLSRKRKGAHIAMMGTALVVDLGVVLYLEVQRGVIESIPQRDITPLLILHICVGVAVLVLYGVQVVTGIRNARGRRSAWHGKVGPWILLVRLGNLITSFLVV